MSIRWLDVSIPIEPGTTVWPGDPPVSIAPGERIARGAGSNTSVLTLGTHTGTHVDAPWHFEDDGGRLEAIDTQRFFGDALVVHVPGVRRVRAEHLGSGPLPPRVLFKTDNSQLPTIGPFDTDYAALEADAAQRLVDAGVELVGVDYLSVAPYRQPGQPTHHILLRNNVLIVEGLRLADVPPGTHPFVVLPLALQQVDGSPCRAFIGLREPATESHHVQP